MLRMKFFLTQSCLALSLLLAGVTHAQTSFPPVNTGRALERIPGKFVWADLVTDDTSAARKFYAGLFGWRFSGTAEHLIARNGSRPVAGFVHRQRPADRPNAQPRWIPYMSVIDVKASVRTTQSMGGRVVAPATVFPGRGEQAVLADRESALFGVIHSASGDPADAVAREGDWVWLQLLSRDASKAAAFYSKLGAYQITKNTAENRTSDVFLSSGGIARATVRTLRDKHRNTAPTWLPFVRVKNIQSSLGKVAKFGGKIVIKPSPDLNQGRIAVVSDPTGAAVGIMEWNPEKP
jgi:predicted enzyme related to lactoylglutathione lyase